MTNSEMKFAGSPKAEISNNEIEIREFKYPLSALNSPQLKLK